MANLGITLHYVITWPPSMHWFWELAVENSTRNLLSTLKIKQLIYQQRWVYLGELQRITIQNMQTTAKPQASPANKHYIMEKEKVGRGCFEYKSREKQEFRVMMFLTGWDAGVVNFLKEMQCTHLCLFWQVIDDSFLLTVLLGSEIDSSSWIGSQEAPPSSFPLVRFLFINFHMRKQQINHKFNWEILKIREPQKNWDKSLHISGCIETMNAQGRPEKTWPKSKAQWDLRTGWNFECVPCLHRGWSAEGRSLLALGVCIQSLPESLANH